MVYHPVLFVKIGGISRGSQLSLEGAQDIRLTVNMYHNGTVMVQGIEASLTQFPSKFKDLKRVTLNYKQDLELKDTAVLSGAVTGFDHHHDNNLTISISRDTVPKIPSSPDTKGLSDALIYRKQDYIMFKKHIMLN